MNDATSPAFGMLASPSAADPFRERTLRGLADVDAGRLIDDEAMAAWADRLGTENESSAPYPT